MVKNILISVIVPIYNTETHLRECIDSILHQSYKNLEILLINDGSRDSSGKICDSYIEVDSRIRVVHQANKGLSGARNLGISLSKGKYLTFIDSDDVIHRDYIKTLYEYSNRADISICYVSKFDNTKPPLENNLNPISHTYSGRQMSEFLFHEKLGLITVIATNKLYKRSIWSDIRFPLGKLHEDCAIMHKILNRASRIQLIQCEMYFYRQHENSITSNRTFESLRDEYDALSDQVIFFSKQNQMSLVRNANRSRKALFLNKELNINWETWRKYTVKEIIHDDLRTKIKIRLLFKKFRSWFSKIQK